MFSFNNKVFTSRNRMTRIPSSSTGCLANEWMSVKSKGLITTRTTTPLASLVKSLDTVINYAFRYIKRYWRYNALFNCQHFATNMVNKITGMTFDFTDSAWMDVHSLTSNAKNNKLEFDLSGNPITAKNYIAPH